MTTGNTQTKNLNFGEAMEYLKIGRSVIRDGWNGKGMCLTAQFPDENSKMTHPYLFMTIPDCDEGIRKLPWQPAQVDIFSNDWSVLDTQHLTKCVTRQPQANGILLIGYWSR